MYTQNNDLIAGTFLNSKKLAKAGTLEVIDKIRAIMSSGPGGGNPFTSTEVSTFASTFLSTQGQGQNPYNSASLFKQISTEAEYMAWAFIYPQVQQGYSQLLSGATLLTPEAAVGSKIGTMECKMSFSRNVSGEVILNIPVSTEGQPKDGNAIGTGTLTSEACTIAANVTLTFSSGNPSNMIFAGTMTGSPEGSIYISMTPTTGSGSGTITIEGTTGTIEVGASGGTIYFPGTSPEAFIF